MKSTVPKFKDWYHEKLIPTEDDEMFILLAAIVVCKNNVRLTHFATAPITPNRRETIIKCKEQVWSERLYSTVEYIKEVKGYNNLERKKGDALFQTKKARAEKAYLGWFEKEKLKFTENKQEWTEVIKSQATYLSWRYPLDI